MQLQLLVLRERKNIFLGRQHGVVMAFIPDLVDYDWWYYCAKPKKVKVIFIFIRLGATKYISLSFWREKVDSASEWGKPY